MSLWTEADFRPGTAGPLPPHVVGLPGESGWALWRSIGLRSAGFPAELVNGLADPSCTAAADRLSDAEGEFHRARELALAAINAELDAAGSPAGVSLARRHPDLVAALRGVKAGRDVPATGRPPADAALAAMAHAARRRDDAASAYRTAFADSGEHTTAAVRDLLDLPRLREAIAWQNPHAYRNAVLPLRRADARPSRNSRRRQHEQLIALTTARYAVKNDSIGFFGPIGWAEFTGPGPALAVVAGPDLLRSRAVHFEQWAVDELADALGERATFDRWARPRRLPSAHLDGTVLYQDSAPHELDPAMATVLAACDGRRTADEVARALTSAGVPGLADPAGVLRCLHRLRALGLIVWRLEVPFTTDADVALRDLLASVDDPAVRTPAVRTVEVMRAARDAVARSAGDPDRLDIALDRLGTVFTKLTGAAPTRHAGQTYAARTLVYEDCVRDVDVRFGPQLLQELAAPLAMVLQSARWVTWTVAERYRKRLTELYHEAAAELGTRRVPATELWRRLPELFRFLHTDPGADEGEAVDGVRDELTRRWTRALSVDPGSGRRLSFTSDEVAGRVRDAFAAPAPGWELARYHSPDVMIAAADPEAIRRGDYLFVLGEVHIASNTLGAALFVDAHPDGARFADWTADDLPEPSVTAVSPRQWRGTTSRTRAGIRLAHDYFLLMSDEFVADPAIPAEHLLAIGELYFEESGGQLRVSTYDGRFARGADHLLGELMSQDVLNAFRMCAPRGHVPRITIDRLVVQRETWRVPVGDLVFPAAGTDAERFRLARSWAAGLGLPRRVFYRVATEDKPILLDLQSPVLVEIFAKVLRRAVRRGPPGIELVVTEMVPGVEDAWLTDADGQHYTSELRIVAVDQAGRPDEGRRTRS
ncbi:lantibiotic dehydratase [Jidongwangia harbinensis]|uniref:lantibiotic dehydratase n=1 Tax=Jidongwangia harbinensis TaxID=2878561 RepID=UPI001CD9A394|nr:lantibiotic dehydratase [Jidongwangia harbinensis]MCA2219346.1 lantibiotic dehydratase family protein [Jidongwangia harbinensis]